VQRAGMATAMRRSRGGSVHDAAALAEPAAAPPVAAPAAEESFDSIHAHLQRLAAVVQRQGVAAYTLHAGGARRQAPRLEGSCQLF
jgi:hypothetical protein